MSYEQLLDTHVQNRLTSLYTLCEINESAVQSGKINEQEYLVRMGELQLLYKFYYSDSYKSAIWKQIQRYEKLSSAK